MYPRQHIFFILSVTCHIPDEKNLKHVLYSCSLSNSVACQVPIGFSHRDDSNEQPQAMLSIKSRKFLQIIVRLIAYSGTMELQIAGTSLRFSNEHRAPDSMLFSEINCQYFACFLTKEGKQHNPQSH